MQSAKGSYLGSQNNCVTNPAVQVCSANPEVCRLYKDILNRLPESGGAYFWTGRLAILGSQYGSTYAYSMVAAEFGQSAEYLQIPLTSKAVSNNSNWTRNLGITNVPCAEPYSCRYDQAVAAIRFMYINFLGRDAETGGLQFYLAQAASGRPFYQIQNDIENSSEAHDYLISTKVNQGN